MIFSKKKFYKDLSGNSPAYFVKNDYLTLSKKSKDFLDNEHLKILHTSSCVLLLSK